MTIDRLVPAGRSRVPNAAPPTPAAPIGVFDSGVGGLSVLQAIRRALPDEDLVYVADSGHAPYGDRDRAFIERRAAAIAEFLVGLGAKSLVIACNTATVVAVERLRSTHALPIVAMEPAIKPAVRRTRSKVVGVLATAQTLKSAAVGRLCERHGDGVRLMLQPCPGLAERVEQGDLDGETTRRLLAGYLAPIVDAGADTLVLGCTHYPFLEPAIRAIVGPSVEIVESSHAVARELARRLDAQGQRRQAASVGGGVQRFYTTGALDEARAVMSRLWGAAVDVCCVDPASPRQRAGVAALR